MKLSILAILVGVGICCIGCEGGNSIEAGIATSAAAHITYTKDKRSGLCFGMITNTTKDGYQVISLTNVPCANVEPYLAKEQP